MQAVIFLSGQFITLDRQNPTGTGVGQSDSREVTFYKGKKLIEEVGAPIAANMVGFVADVKHIKFVFFYVQRIKHRTKVSNINLY